MLKKIGDKIRFPAWAKKDERFKFFEIRDRLLNGEFYDHLKYCFYDETQSNGELVLLENRRPSVRFNIFRMLGTQLGRKLFAGKNAPRIVHDKENVRLAAMALVQEGNLTDAMLQGTEWGMVGAFAVTYKILAYGDKSKSKLVATLWRAKNCVPTFNEVRELDKLRIQYTIPGADLMAQGMKIDFEQKPLVGRLNYWYVKDLTRDTEIVYYPIPELKWDPADYNSECLIDNPDESLQEPHNLGYVQAHWFHNKQGDVRWYDGVCLFEDAINNVIDMDYTLSQIGSGVRYNAAPQLVIKGNLAGEDQDRLGPSRVIQFDPDRKDPDGISEEGGDAKLLEMNGQGIKVGIDSYITTVEKFVMKVLSASLKDPNKVTTAMSGAGMKVIESEFYDLIQEFRTTYGDNCYLKLLKKTMSTAIEVDHPLMEGINPEDVDALTLGWPPLTELSPSEWLPFVQGLTEAFKWMVIDSDEMRAIFASIVDLPAVSANKNYLESLQGARNKKPVLVPGKRKPRKKKEDTGDGVDVLMAQSAAAAESMAQTGPLTTT